jgi:transposase-like protein
MAMIRGRPPLGPAHVERLQGSPEAKARLEAILQTLAGTLTIPEACQRLGIAETRFHDLRREVLQEALGALEVRPRGRPSRPVAPDPDRLERLERQVARLQLDLHAAQIREELALVMPHVLHPPEPSQSKKKVRGPDAP